MLRARLLPDFYQQDFSALPASTELDQANLVLWLRQDNKRGAVVLGAEDVAVWTGDESGADDGYYTQPLPLEEPDANWEGTAEIAVASAVEQAG